MKFGGEAVKRPEAFASIADLIIQRSREYQRIAIVVSAMSGMTNQLIAMAHQVNSAPPRREYDMLVSAGERISIALLAMALEAQGKEAVSFTGSQSGMITNNHHTEAKIVDVKPHRLNPPLQEGKFVIVAGFQGVSAKGEITTLGRGGSDATAVALAIALSADQVEFYKDVTGIFDADPKINPEAKQYYNLLYGEALDVVYKTGGKVLLPRCIELAAKNAIPLYILSFEKRNRGTLIYEKKMKPSTPIYEE